ncbi:hypothetical protein FRB95_005671 [Tulasnella sp. JGI-2019a]|nr:hypothetical protein FRB95_005671 [Tulasnella sp. JGI-2019a]
MRAGGGESQGEGDDDDDDDEADYRFRKRRIESNFSRYDHDSDEDDATNETCDATVDSDDNPDEEDTAWIINKQKSRIDAEAEIQYGGRQTKEDLDDVDTSLRKFALRGGTRQDSKSRNLFVEPPDSMATLRQDAAQASTLRASANRFRDNKPALEDAARMTTAKRGTESSTNLLPDKAADDQSFLDSLL